MAVEKYINRKELADRLGGVCETTIWRGVKSGGLPKPYKFGAHNLWLWSEVQDHLAAKREAA